MATVPATSAGPGVLYGIARRVEQLRKVVWPDRPIEGLRHVHRLSLSIYQVPRPRPLDRSPGYVSRRWQFKLAIAVHSLRKQWEKDTGCTT